MLKHFFQLLSIDYDVNHMQDDKKHLSLHHEPNINSMFF